MSATRVLIVDDDALIRASMAEVLSSEGYAVTEAADGADALRLASEVEPEIVLLDLALPGHSGIEVLKVLQAERPTREMRVVVVSAYAQLLLDEDVRHDGVLHKPFALDELLQRVRQLDPTGPSASG
jgi:DNA-binding response OmpR family regulator